MLFNIDKPFADEKEQTDEEQTDEEQRREMLSEMVVAELTDDSHTIELEDVEMRHLNNTDTRWGNHPLASNEKEITLTFIVHE